MPSTPPLSRVTLEIVGIPGEEVSIYPETPLDAPPPPIFEGVVPPGGHLRLRVPRAPMVVVAARFGTVPVRASGNDGTLLVDVRPAAPDQGN